MSCEIYYTKYQASRKNYQLEIYYNDPQVIVCI